MTAENHGGAGRGGGSAGRFNEAAADDRGKPWKGTCRRTCRPSFNEAAADDRGKPHAPCFIRESGAVLQ